MSMTPPSAADWMEVLARIETALQSSLDRATTGEPATEETDGTAQAAALALDLLGQRQARLQASLDQAERDADRAEAPLTAEAEVLEAWRRRGQAARERLARAIGRAF
jgi:hypothetical protein